MRLFSYENINPFIFEHSSTELSKALHGNNPVLNHKDRITSKFGESFIHAIKIIEKNEMKLYIDLMVDCHSLYAFVQIEKENLTGIFRYEDVYINMATNFIQEIIQDRFEINMDIKNSNHILIPEGKCHGIIERVYTEITKRFNQKIRR